MIVQFRNVLLQYSKNPRLRTRIFPSQPKQVLTEMVTSTNLGYLGSYFLKKKQIIAMSIYWCSAYSLIKSAQVFSSDSLIKSACHYIQLYIAVGRIILQRGSSMHTYLLKLLYSFLQILQNKNLFQILGLTGSSIEGT